MKPTSTDLQDFIERFLTECCEFSPESHVGKGTFYEAYCSFAKSMNAPPKSISEVCKTLKNLSIEEKRTKTKRFWKGLKLREISSPTTIRPSPQLAAPLQLTAAEETLCGIHSEAVCGQASSSQNDAVEELILRNLQGEWERRRL